MKKSRIYISRVLVLFGAAFLGACAHDGPVVRPDPAQPPVKATTRLNTTEPQEKVLALPAELNSYQSKLGALVGAYIALVPDTTSPTGHRVKLLDRALTTDGERVIETFNKNNSSPIYQSRVEAKFGADLSFVAGHLQLASDSLYEFTVADTDSALIPPDSKFIDQGKARALAARLPSTYKDLIFITTVTRRAVAYKEYIKVSGNGDGGFALVKAGANFYAGSEFTSNSQILYVGGLSDAALYGTLDPQTGLYRKNANPITAADLLKRNALSDSTLRLLQSTVRRTPLLVD